MRCINFIKRSIGIIATLLCVVCVVLIVSGCPVEQAAVLLGGSLDGDFDGDGVLNDVDNCVLQNNPQQHDRDSDGVGDGCDNCPQIINQMQEDGDRDGYGNSCDVCASDHRYALESEGLFCAEESVREYSFSISGSTIVRPTDANRFYFHHKFQSIDFGHSLAYLGKNILTGEQGAVIGVGASEITYDYGGEDDHPYKDISSENRAFFIHLRSDPQLKIEYVTHVSDIPSSVQPNSRLENFIGDGRNSTGFTAIADLGVHTVDSKQQRLVAIGDGKDKAMRIFFFDSQTTWYDPSKYGATADDLTIKTRFYRTIISRLANGETLDMLGDSVAHLGITEYGGRKYLMVLVGYDSGEIGPKKGQVFLLHVNLSDRNATKATVIEGKVNADHFGQSMTAVSEYNTLGTYVFAVSSDRIEEATKDGAGDVGGIYLYRATPNADVADTVTEIPIRTRSGGLITASAFYTEEVLPDTQFGRSLHNLGDIDGTGPADTVLAVGCPLCDSFSADDRKFRIYDNRGAVYFLYLSAVKSDSDGVEYVELLKYERVDHRTKNGPQLKNKGGFGTGITSFQMANKKYLVVGAPSVDEVHFIEYK